MVLFLKICKRQRKAWKKWKSSRNIAANIVKSAENPKFEVYRDEAGQFRFRLKAPNGEIVLASEGYTAKASCEHGISSVRKNAVNALVIEPAFSR